MIVLLVAAVGFIGGFFCACLCFSAREDQLQYREARRVARRMDDNLYRHSR